MKTLIQTISLMAIPVTCLASQGTSEISPLMMAFLGFGAAVLVIQSVPAGVLFVSMVKGLFSKTQTSILERN